MAGTNPDGSCRYCSGRERELGEVVVLHDPPRDEEAIDRLYPPRPNPGPTPCPQCGRDLNTTIVVKRVSIEEWAAGRSGSTSNMGKRATRFGVWGLDQFRNFPQSAVTLPRLVSLPQLGREPRVRDDRAASSIKELA